ncbi:MAG: hypothetical protein AAGC74_05570 [Verrucomicrobiota bacterium]
MKTTITTLLATTTLLLAQGPLTPPGAPAPTMKTLDQIEPRTPLIAGSPGVSINGSGTITISQSGSYYLTGNLSVTSGDGIFITASGVTLDLNGFTISSTSATPAGTAIDINASNISVSNGHILSGVTYDSGATGDQFSGSGISNGIDTNSTNYENIRLQNLSVQGVDFGGILCSNLDSTLVEFCTVTVCGFTGIRAGLVKHCSVENAGAEGILAREVSFCYAISVGSDGIDASNNAAYSTGVTSSTSTSSHGIRAGGNVINSVGQSSGGDGIRCLGNVLNSNGFTNGSGGGIDALNVSHSTGVAASAASNGIEAGFNVTSSYGFSNISKGIFAGGTVSNSYGVTNGTSSSSDGIHSVSGPVTASTGQTSGSGKGIWAALSISDSYGVSSTGDGLYGTTVTNSFGQTNSAASDGIFAFGTIANCRASNPSGAALDARIISASTAVNGTINASVAKVDGTP